MQIPIQVKLHNIVYSEGAGHLLFGKTPDSAACSSPVGPTPSETCSPSPE